MANGIKLGSQEVFADFASNGLRFTFSRGGLQSLATFVGEDDDVPLASGMEAGQWRASYREVALHGFVTGTGSSAQAIRESFRTASGLITSVMNPASLLTITVYTPHFGLASGHTATLANCRPMSIDGPDPAELAWYEAWEVTLNLRSIASPPNWSVS